MNRASPGGCVASMCVRGGTTASPAESCRKASFMTSTASAMGKARATSRAERKRSVCCAMVVLPSFHIERCDSGRQTSAYRRRFMALADGVAARPPRAVQRSSLGSILPTACTASMVSSSGMGLA